MVARWDQSMPDVNTEWNGANMGCHNYPKISAVSLTPYIETSLLNTFSPQHFRPGFPALK